jgi:hypothetical protein
MSFFGGSEGDADVIWAVIRQIGKVHWTAHLV